MRKLLSTYVDPSDTFIVAVPTYSILQSSTLPAFEKFNRELGWYHKTDRIFHLHHGPKIFFRSMDNPYAVEGVTNCRGIWLDEGGLITTRAWINIMGRAAPRECQIFISTTPYNLYNYLFVDIYDPWRRGERDDVECIQFRSVDNPYFPQAEYERQRSLLDPRVFAMRYDGRFERMSGLVYGDLDSANLIDPFHLEKRHYHIWGGIDFGYSDPFAIVIRAISRDGKHDYQIAEYLRAGHTPDEQAAIAERFHRTYQVDNWVCDSADPGMIQLFAKRGLPVSGVKKVHNSIEYGIGLHNAIIRSKTHQIVRTLDETLKEYETYCYPDLKDERNPSTKPISFNDHLLDATRYITMSTVHLRDKAFEAYVPQKTHLQKLLSGEYRPRASLMDEW